MMSEKSSLGRAGATTSASTSAECPRARISRRKGRDYSKNYVKIPSIVESRLRVSKHQINNLKDIVNQPVIRRMSLQSRLLSAEDLYYKASFQQIIKNTKSPVKLILYLRSKRLLKRPTKRQFNILDVILSLSLYCKSRKCYSLLAEIFILPRAKALKSLLSKVVINPGLNDIIFESLTDVAENLTTQYLLCTLMFKEMLITPQIHYNSIKDEFKGFVTIGEKRIADRVLVFMLKGIKAKYRQPIAYYLTNNLTKCDLKQIIKSVIEHVTETGLKIICTVCTPTPVNVGAITDLVNETKEIMGLEKNKWKNDFFKIQNHYIIPLYDVRHVLKALRNHLLTKDMKYIDFNDDNKEKIMKWEYIQMVYDLDKDIKYLSNLTDEHVYADKVNKMNVQTAVQVFSHRVAALTNFVTAQSQLSSQKPPLLPEECRQLVPITKLFDNLVDSLNGNTVHVPDGKEYQGCLKKSSPHHKLWDKALITLRSIKFIKKRKFGDELRITDSTVPAVELFIKTIEGMQVLWPLLHKKYLLKHLLTRNFSLDPVEVFFKNINSFSDRKYPPNSVSFDNVYKSMLLNKYIKPPDHMCYYAREDKNFWLLDLDMIIFHQIDSVNLNIGDTYVSNVSNLKALDKTGFNTCDLYQKNYLCWWALNKCFKTVIIKSCTVCESSLTCNKYNLKISECIRAKKYNYKRRWLSFPSEKFENCFNDLQNVINSFLKKDFPIYKLKKNIKMFCDEHIEYPFVCDIHRERLVSYFKDVTIDVTIYSWCRSVNRILSGSIPYNGDDEVKVAAQLYYNKHSKK